MPRRLIEIVEKLPSARVVLVGDLMIDRYIYGNAERLSPDAPVPVLQYQHEEVRLGGAGRVAEDLARLGASVRMVGVVGDDDTGGDIQRLLEECGINCDCLEKIAGRRSTSKVRLVGLAQHRHPQQMMRLDHEDASPIDTERASRLMGGLEQLFQDCDLLCIEDYNKGLLSPQLCRQIIEAARRSSVPVLVDPAAIDDFAKYAGATAITPNRTEAERATGFPCSTESEYRVAAEWLLEKLNLEAAVLTLDRHGAYLATGEGERRWLTTRPRDVYDVTGAGDMVLAMLAMARTGGATWAEAVALANIAGGIEVEQSGSVPISREQIVQELLREVHDGLGKQRTLDQLLVELRSPRASGRKIVFTNGCFDLIHLGHIKYFQFAKAQGDLLVVAVNSDSSIRRLKGSKRPIINEHDRMRILEELESIDYLIRFDDETPIDLIRQIRPDVLVKGADYAKEEVVGWDVVESSGGRVALAPLVDGRSTSAVIERILEAYQ